MWDKLDLYNGTVRQYNADRVGPMSGVFPIFVCRPSPDAGGTTAQTALDSVLIIRKHSAAALCPTAQESAHSGMSRPDSADALATSIPPPTSD